MAVTVAAIIVVMIVPIPFVLLDLLMTLSIAVSLVIMMVTIYLANPLEISVFPALILVTTLFRLALNVASTRLILLYGNNFNGKVIIAFGDFVLGGNYVVGIVIFVILYLVQVKVITAGSGRIAEVAARFTLDAMPGKQLAIDADLNNGLIDEKEATKRREELARQADFYGAMDGAAKFVRGDVTAGMFITAINVIGGFFIGVIQLKIPWQEAASIYTKFTIGDGLIAQIPSLLISMASGLVVTRAASKENLGSELTAQLLMRPKPLLIASGVLTVLAFMGLPTLPFLTLAGIIFGFWYVLDKNQKTKQAIQAEVAEENVKKSKDEVTPENVEELLQVDPIELEIGYGLIMLVDTGQGGNLLDRITLIRRQCAMELGFIVPPIRIRDNMKIKGNNYVIKIKGTEVAQGEVMPDQLLAMDVGLAKGELPGVATREPAFGLNAYWVQPALKDKAESLGYTVVEAASVLSTHLTEIVKRYAYELVTRQEVKNILDTIKKKSPAVVDEVVPSIVTIGEILKVIKNLLKEKVSIRNMVTILETLADYAPLTKDIDTLTEYVRHALSRTISKQYESGENKLRVLTLDPQLEEYIAASIKRTEHTSYLAIEPQKAQEMLMTIAKEVEKVVKRGEQPVILCSPQIRNHLKKFTERQIPNLVVLSFNEIAPEMELESQGMVASL